MKPIGEAVSRLNPDNTTTSTDGCVYLPQLFAKATVKDFETMRPIDPDWEREKIDPVLRDAINHVVNGLKPWPLFVTGGVGTGKTYAAYCMIEGYMGLHFTASTLCETLNMAREGTLQWTSAHMRSVMEIWRDIREAPLITLDELGARATVSDFQCETVQKVIDVRKGKPAVYLSNLSLTELARVYDGRVADRLAAGTIVKLTGKSRRKGERFKADDWQEGTTR